MTATSPRRRNLLTGLTGLALAASLLAPSLAFAGPGQGKGKQKRHGDRVAKMCEQMSCTDQQEQEITQVFKQMRVDVRVDRKAIRELRKQIAEEWVKDRPSEAKLAKLADKVAAHERNIADRRMDAMMELHGVLDAEQRKQLAEHMMRKHKRKRGKKAKKAKQKRAR